MPNPLSRWLRSLGLGGKSGPLSPADLGSRLERLEAEAESADPGFQGIPLNRAGDLCVLAGRKERALEYFGRAIDSYLDDGQPAAARAVAQKLIRLHPRAIRTLCTITWLDLAAGHMGDALFHLGEYVEAARRGGQESHCREQILEMAGTVGDADFRSTAAEGLRDLGFREDAAVVRRWIEADEGPAGAGSSDELKERCFSAAVGSNLRREEEDGGRGRRTDEGA
ncbi:MAG: hypothetical protein PVI57_08395 [Gemmatimonadota bacterium]|jgi:hypothetical protein